MRMQRNLGRGLGRPRHDGARRASQRGLLVELIVAPFLLGGMLALLAMSLLFGALPRRRDQPRRPS